ncbi:hypothetical protein KP509_37G055400 [Ceratopteris richardii]|uniref:Chalcone synthase n=2 Tax=Ceratopteris richardii TaxID=49495 RepID=A0A8T2QAC5_CERRI|nr:hypothetical protein KP509_37G055400 [Ceratopteris richardii]
MFLEVEVAAQGRREWVPAESVPGTPRPSCPTWIEQPSPRVPLPQAPTWVEPPSPRLTPRSSAGHPPNVFPPPEKARACVLAMGRATPPNKIDQSTYTDWYFNITNSSHKVELKQKMQRICDRSGIQNRYSILTEEFLKEHPEFYTPGEPSLEQRNAIFAEEVPKLAHEAAMQAIAEWGRPASEITHLVVATLTGVAIPGADVMLTKSLGLRPDVNRVMLYMLGCYAGVTALRVAKDLAENNPSSRILICCSELAAPTFRAPNEKFPYDLVGTALFGDGASGVIVGAQPQPRVERPLYEIEWVGEVLAPDSEKIIEGTLKLEGLQFYLDRTLPGLVSKHVGGFCRTALDNAPEKPNFNDVFWAVHSGGPAILNAVEEALQLHPEKLAASRHILKHYGNISASTVLFVLDELRKADSPADNQSNCEWGIAVAFGPGVTIEGALLKRCKQ